MPGRHNGHSPNTGLRLTHDTKNLIPVTDLSYHETLTQVDWVAEALESLSHLQPVHNCVV